MDFVEYIVDKMIISLLSPRYCIVKTKITSRFNKWFVNVIMAASVHDNKLGADLFSLAKQLRLRYLNFVFPFPNKLALVEHTDVSYKLRVCYIE